LSQPLRTVFSVLLLRGAYSRCWIILHRYVCDPCRSWLCSSGRLHESS